MFGGLIRPLVHDRRNGDDRVGLDAMGEGEGEDAPGGVTNDDDFANTDRIQERFKRREMFFEIVCLPTSSRPTEAEQIWNNDAPARRRERVVRRPEVPT